MIFKLDYLQAGVAAGAIAAALTLSACANDDQPSATASGPGVENPAAAPFGGAAPPAVGGAGNGGGISGGGAGAGGVGQGAR